LDDFEDFDFDKVFGADMAVCACAWLCAPFTDNDKAKSNSVYVVC